MVTVISGSVDVNGKTLTAGQSSGVSVTEDPNTKHKIVSLGFTDSTIDKTDKPDKPATFAETYGDTVTITKTTSYGKNKEPAIVTFANNMNKPAAQIEQERQYGRREETLYTFSKGKEVTGTISESGYTPGRFQKTKGGYADIQERQSISQQEMENRASAALPNATSFLQSTLSKSKPEGKYQGTVKAAPKPRSLSLTTAFDKSTQWMNKKGKETGNHLYSDTGYVLGGLFSGAKEVEYGKHGVRAYYPFQTEQGKYRYPLFEGAVTGLKETVEQPDIPSMLIVGGLGLASGIGVATPNPALKVSLAAAEYGVGSYFAYKGYKDYRKSEKDNPFNYYGWEAGEEGFTSGGWVGKQAPQAALYYGVYKGASVASEPLGVKIGTKLEFSKLKKVYGKQGYLDIKQNNVGEYYFNLGYEKVNLNKQYGNRAIFKNEKGGYYRPISDFIETRKGRLATPQPKTSLGAKLDTFNFRLKNRGSQERYAFNDGYYPLQRNTMVVDEFTALRASPKQKTLNSHFSDELSVFYESKRGGRLGTEYHNYGFPKEKGSPAIYQYRLNTKGTMDQDAFRIRRNNFGMDIMQSKLENYGLNEYSASHQRVSKGKQTSLNNMDNYNYYRLFSYEPTKYFKEKFSFYSVEEKFGLEKSRPTMRINRVRSGSNTRSIFNSRAGSFRGQRAITEIETIGEWDWGKSTEITDRISITELGLRPIIDIQQTLRGGRRGVLFFGRTYADKRERNRFSGLGTFDLQDIDTSYKTLFKPIQRIRQKQEQKPAQRYISIQRLEQPQEQSKLYINPTNRIPDIRPEDIIKPPKPEVPGGILFGLPLMGTSFGKGSKFGYGGKKKLKYTPNLVGMVLGIKTKNKNPVVTGFEIRGN